MICEGISSSLCGSGSHDAQCLKTFQLPEYDELKLLGLSVLKVHEIGVLSK